MKIRPFNLQYLDLPNTQEFLTRMKTLTDKSGAEELDIDAVYGNVFVPAFLNFDNACVQVRKSGKTDEIVDTDILRDKLTSSVISTVKAGTNDFDPEVVKAAEELLIVCNDSGFKGLARKTLNAQTAATTNFLQLFMGKYATQVTLLGLDKKVTELKRLNDKIHALMSERGEETTEKRKANTENARRDAISGYRAVTQQVEINCMIYGAKKYEDYINNLNVIIGEFGGVSGKTTPSKDETGEPETPIVEDKYPDAREWTNMVDVEDFKLGDICFVVVDGVKKYYKMIDESNFNVRPNGGEGELGWEPVE